MNRFRDRVDAGRQLAVKLMSLRGSGAIVLGLPRGGVEVANEVARLLHTPLDVLVVRKIGVPTQPELAMGAVGEGGVVVVDRGITDAVGISNAGFDAVLNRERIELDRRIVAYRGRREPTPLTGRTVVIVDDGIATGSTARAACQVVRARGASKIILAVPVVAEQAVKEFRDVADELVAVEVVKGSFSVGQWYEDFDATSDSEVISCLDEARGRADQEERITGSPSPNSNSQDEVAIQLDDASLIGNLCVPTDARGIVLFAHGSGSSRLSPRNTEVARDLQARGFGTLLFDLLTSPESQDRRNVFDVSLLSRRLSGATQWLVEKVGRSIPIGYFGASTGAAAALISAADSNSRVHAIVSRGGRVDLAGDCLRSVHAPTLMIVGGADLEVLELNRRALAQFTCECQLEIVANATHLFEEPGAMEEVTSLAGRWFARHFESSLEPCP